jgi:hypothetical protein
MDNIEKAKKMFFELESRSKNPSDVARRNFEIESRLSKYKL